MKTLIIVDPQNDFITGTLPVSGAEEQMNNLAKKLSHIAVDHIIVTMDCHPIKHCSFSEQGGEWPSHCVKYSHGAAIWEPLMEALKHHSAPITFLEKGCQLDKDEYSAFEHSYPQILKESNSILICGIAGNVCVLNSIKDLIHHGLTKKLSVITDASPSLDDGSALAQLIEENKIHTTTLEEAIK